MSRPGLGVCSNHRQFAVVREALSTIDLDCVDLSVLDGCLRQNVGALPEGVSIGAYRAIDAKEPAQSVTSDTLSLMARNLADVVADSPAETLTFGSGEFRKWLHAASASDTTTTRTRLVEFVGELVRGLRGSNVQVLIEPLNEAESPVWNSLDECSADLAGIDVDLVADRQHTWSELLSAPKEVLEKVVVVHLCGPGRAVPSHGEVRILLEQLPPLPRLQRILWECRWSSAGDVSSVIGSSTELLS